MYLPDYFVQVPHFLIHFYRMLVGLHVIRGGANCEYGRNPSESATAPGCTSFYHVASSLFLTHLWTRHWSLSLESLCRYLPSLASRVMPTSAALRHQRNLRLHSASATGSGSAPVPGCPLQSGELHRPVFVAVYSFQPKTRHGNSPFSPAAPRSNPCGRACDIRHPCSSYILRSPHS